MKRILIDLQPEIHKALKHKAIDQGKDLKNYIQDHLITLAGKKVKTKDSPMSF